MHFFVISCKIVHLRPRPEGWCHLPRRILHAFPFYIIIEIIPQTKGFFTHIDAIFCNILCCQQHSRNPCIILKELTYSYLSSVSGWSGVLRTCDPCRFSLHIHRRSLSIPSHCRVSRADPRYRYVSSSENPSEYKNIKTGRIHYKLWQLKNFQCALKFWMGTWNKLYLPE